MKKKIIIGVIIAVLACLGIVEGVGLFLTSKKNKQLISIVEKQTSIIDSLANSSKVTYSIALSMDVTDKSTYKINGKGNNGSIIAPSNKEYKLILDIDSVSITTTAK